MTAFLLSACQVVDNDAFQTQRGFEFLKQKKFHQAEAIFQATVLRQENKYREIKAENAGKVNKTEAEQGKRLAQAYDNLAIVFFQSGQYGQSEDALEKAIEIYSHYFGRQNNFVAEASGLLAASFFKQGKLLEAERYYKEELEIKKVLLKPDSLELARISNNLASIYQQLGADEEAEGYFRWALNLCKTVKPNEKEMEQFADILNNLALFYVKQEYYEEAHDTVNQALEIESKHKGVEFLVDKVRSLLVLASIEKATFELDEAEAHYQEALELVDKHLSGRTDLSCEALEKYASFLMAERKFDEAAPIFERWIKASERAHGVDHPRYAEALLETAHLKSHQGQLKEAEELLRRALAIQENTIGIDTSAFLSTVHRLATVLSEQHREKEADKLYQDIVPKLKQRIGPDHPFVADTFDNWSGFVEKIDDHNKAQELRSKARLIRKKMAHSLYQ